VVASIINPQLLITPASGAKGTVFSYVGTGFTPNRGITEVIFKPDGSNYPASHYISNESGSFARTYNSATASIMGTYTITWFDDATGRQSNQVKQTINSN